MTIRSRSMYRSVKNKIQKMHNFKTYQDIDLGYPLTDLNMKWANMAMAIDLKLAEIMNVGLPKMGEFYFFFYILYIL